MWNIDFTDIIFDANILIHRNPENLLCGQETRFFKEISNWWGVLSWRTWDMTFDNNFVSIIRFYIPYHMRIKCRLNDLQVHRAEPGHTFVLEQNKRKLIMTYVNLMSWIRKETFLLQSFKMTGSTIYIMNLNFIFYSQEYNRCFILWSNSIKNYCMNIAFPKGDSHKLNFNDILVLLC
jgi:hypothetical protein